MVENLSPFHVFLYLIFQKEKVETFVDFEQ